MGFFMQDRAQEDIVIIPRAPTINNVGGVFLKNRFEKGSVDDPHAIVILELTAPGDKCPKFKIDVHAFDNPNRIVPVNTPQGEDQGAAFPSPGTKPLNCFLSSFDSVKSQFLTNYDVEVVKTKMDLTGASYGLPTLKDSCLTFNSNGVSPDGTENNAGPEMMSLEMSEVSQCVMRGTGKDRNLIELQFQDNDNLEKVRPESRKRLYHIYIYIFPSNPPPFCLPQRSLRSRPHRTPTN